MDDLPLPFNQSVAFEQTCKRLELPVQRIETGQGTCLLQSRKFPLIGTFNLISRGPVLRDPAQLPAFVEMLRAKVRGPLVINADANLSAPGGLKLLSGAELAILDLSTPAQMRARLHQKWRNQLRKGEASPLTVVDQPLDAARHQWFLNAEQAQQKARRYRNYPPGFLLAFAAANKGAARVYTAFINQTPVAAMLVLKHGKMATYQAGVTTAQGRLHCAHNLILWRIMTDLYRCKCEQLDLGRIDLSDGLKRFKLGAGARSSHLPGSFLFHRFLPFHGSKSARVRRPVQSAS